MSIQNAIEDKLNQELDPHYLEVINEGYLHNVSPGAESHFKLTLVCQTFEGMKLSARHRLVNQLLQLELENNIHSLTLHTYTASEWHHLFGGPQSTASGLRSSAVA